jgi:hypothetical protein
MFWLNLEISDSIYQERRRSGTAEHMVCMIQPLPTPSPPTIAKSSASDESMVFVAGGHDNQKNALQAAEVYDANADEWRTLPAMAEERDECQGISWEEDSRFWVVSGYSTDSQGLKLRAKTSFFGY